MEVENINTDGEDVSETDLGEGDPVATTVDNIQSDEDEARQFPDSDEFWQSHMAAFPEAGG